MCCRDHDHCENWISALEYKHGMRNYYPSTISHCDCDNQFRSCLMKLKDGTADYVGQAYFNVLKIPCFELEEGEGCVDWNFWLECTESKIMPVAKLVSAAPYQAQAETQSGEGRKRSRKKRKWLGQTHLDAAGQRGRLGTQGGLHYPPPLHFILTTTTL
uniref:Type III phospholipase A2 toxin 2 n=1 Tax=Heloderma suspectum cinctum TaxID=537493 RepID=C6EVH0_HELSC|nr:type III phospholipase A2 toxin 2 [Heloderma suspectum cinctum]